MSARDLAQKLKDRFGILISDPQEFRGEITVQLSDPDVIAEICALPQVRGKLVLNVMDGLVAGYAGGPAFKPQYSWNYGGLLFSRDPGGPGVSGISPAALVKPDGRPGRHSESSALKRIGA